MLGRIGFEGLRLNCIIGMEPHERQKEQKLIIDLKVESDLTAAAHSDDVRDTINYTELAELCEQIACQGRYFLLEKLVVDITAAILKRFQVSSVWVRVRKPGAMKGAECAIVELETRQ